MSRPVTPPALVVPALARAPQGPHDPILAHLAPGVYSYPAPFPGYVGRLVIIGEPGGAHIPSFAVLPAEHVDTSTDVAFEHFRALREDMVRRSAGRRRGLRLVRHEAQSA